MYTYRIEVIADSSGHWAGNAMIYGTFPSAEDAALDLAGRWTLVTKARVVLMDEDGKALETTVVFPAVEESIVVT